MEITPKQAQELLGLARKRIADHLQSHSTACTPEEDPLFQTKLATFVTLTIDGQLRGCIGNLEARSTLWQSVYDNAVSAAFHDHRFSALTTKELERTRIEISILTPPEDLEYTDSADLIQKLRPGVDGVILQKGRAGATFLPQVWQQLPTAELFLGHLCRKAGLSQNCWQEEHPAIQTYQVQKFHEERP